MGNVYLPILFLGILAGLFAVFSVGIASVTGPKRYNRAKVSEYECGIEPTPQPVGGGRFPIKYYLTAMLFIIFDIETVFMLPWAAAFHQFLDLRGLLLAEMFVFVAILAVGYLYIWKRGALQWD